MYISKFAVHNYKCFYDAEPVKLAPGFNIIVGRNNAGKTAFLEALSLNFESHPHRSLSTLPTRESYQREDSSVDVWFKMASDELKNSLRRPDVTFLLPRPNSGSKLFASLTAKNNREEEVANKLLDYFLSQDSIEFRVSWLRKKNEQPRLEIPELPSFSLYKPEPSVGTNQAHFFSYRNEQAGTIRPSSVVEFKNREVAHLLFENVKQRIYRFVAERYNVGACSIGDGKLLTSNAGNLPEVLHNLRDNPKRFQRFSEAVRKILPEVKEVTIKSVANQQVEIRIWPVDPSTERDDLAIPLRESGTGIGQVLAILYVIMNSDQPQILLIDEPQSFLHPGALRKLIEVFKQYSQHQYIISTHAPAVISAANPDVIINILQEEHQSIPRPFNFSNKDELQVCLAQLGASLSDVFGADNIVWVEGPTEAICYPKILSQIAKEPLMGTAIVPVRNTGELQGKRDAERVVDLYNRMSGSNALIPPAISFVFDSECYTDERKEENSNRSAGKAKFLPRRMYECYLLNPRAIANVANSIPGFRETKLTEEEVAELLRQKFETVEYYCQQPIPDNADERRSKINGAKVLRDLFNKLSETRVAFDKLEHSVKLTDWLLKNEPEELKDLADFLVAAVRGRNPK